MPAYATGERAQDPPPPTFRSSVEVVSVSAVVKDRKGRFVHDLQARDFIVAEGGVERRILDFRAETDGPVTLGLLVDASGSMRVGGKAVDAEAAARHLFSALRPADEAALFSFDTQLDRVTDFTSDIASVEQALERLNRPFGQTSLYDAIGQAAEVIAARARKGGALPQRTALVVLTDGIDTRSRSTTGEVTAAASRIDVPVYIVAVMAGVDDPRVYGNPAFDVSGLEQLARGTGGEMFIATAPAHASVAARQIVEELRHQYVLAFEASNRGGWRPVDVRARNGRFTVRARTGYSAGGDRPVPGHRPA
ncbi:MAG TPA: VWA domain-containing protein [Vicinamibacterales bacterium]|nr:VWA domain-containing protein [Vicinamibacterales bacterium]